MFLPWKRSTKEEMNILDKIEKFQKWVTLIGCVLAAAVSGFELNERVSKIKKERESVKNCTCVTCSMDSSNQSN